ncbi:MAG: sugar ABC transporter permease [Fimbriimonadaceae bacterium]|nr:sugar ABC transporter permease [Fimbriimonadaceae bacterium]
MKPRPSLTPYAMLAPTFLLLAVFSLVPFVWAFATSFYEYEVGGASRYVGFANYVEYLHDPTLAISFLNLGILTLFGLAVVVTAPLIVARLIFSLQSERARYLYRVMFLIPIVVPGVAGLMIWQGMVYNDMGFLNELLRLAGRDDLTRGWLTDPRTALWAILFIGFPFAGGINILIYYAGLAGISESVHEAAELDGARGIRKFWKVDVPLVMSQVKLLTILTVIGSVQGFEGMFILTRGGPGFRTMVPGLWMYMNAFTFQRMGYACAIGVILFLLILGMTILNMRYFRSSEELAGETG